MIKPRTRVGATSNERGISLIIIAGSMTALMMVSALVIDGSNSYAARRSMQNAADAGAMAGGQALYKALMPGATMTADTPTDVLQQVNQAITNDGGSLPTDGGDFCDFIDSSGNSQGACTSSGNPPASAVGVKVNAENTRTSFFGNFAGQSKATVGGHAAATIQPLGGSSSPWIMCGSSGNGGYDLLADDGDGETIGTDLDATDPLRSMSVVLLPKFGYGGTNSPGHAPPPPPGSGSPSFPSYATMIVQEEQPEALAAGYDDGCGAGISTDGKGNGDVFANGMTVDAQGNGSHLDHTPNNNTSVPVGTCYNNGSPQTCVPCPTGPLSPSSLSVDGCDLLLPLADWGQGNGKDTAVYHVVQEAVFHILAGAGDQKVVGWLDDPTGFTLTPALTQTGTCPPGSALCVVKLIDFPNIGFVE